MQLQPAIRNGSTDGGDAGRAATTQAGNNGAEQRDGETTRPSGPTLTITGGAHAGVSFNLPDGTYRIGSTAEADIVLTDAGIAPDHAVIRIGRGTLQVEARGGDLELVGHGTLPGGYGRSIRLPAEIQLGEAALRVTDDRTSALRQAARLARRRLMRPVPLVVLALCGALGLALLLLLPSSKKIEDTRAPASTDKAEAAVPTAETAAARLAERLAASNLEMLKTTTTEDNRILVTGAIPKDKTEAWMAVRAWFDATFAGKQLLVSQVTTTEGLPIRGLRLEAIWFGEKPYIITGEGRKYYEGAILESGWMLKSITRTGVVFAKGSDTVTLTY